MLAGMFAGNFSLDDVRNRSHAIAWCADEAGDPRAQSYWRTGENAKGSNKWGGGGRETLQKKTGLTTRRNA
jgi:hypothetical protein